jgi:hypothetical protein
VLRCKACVDFLPDSPRCATVETGGPQKPRSNIGAHIKSPYPDLADKSWDPKELSV